MATYTLTKIKTFRGNEGYGLNATLCRDGKPVCFVMDDANGGCYSYEWHLARKEPLVDVTVRKHDDENGRVTYKGTAEEALFQEHILSLPKEPPCEFFPQGKWTDADGFIARLADQAETLKLVQRKLKSNLCFMLKSDNPKDGFRTVKLKGTQTLDGAKKYIHGKYGPDVIFLNDLPADKQRELMTA